MQRTLTLSRVLALVGGLGLVAAFFMPWFSSQGLLLSGQFLHNFLGGASAADLRRFLPGASANEAQLLKGLVDLFPVAGTLAAVAAVLGGLAQQLRAVSNVVLAVTGTVTLIAWALGVTRLPPGANPEVGLALIAAGGFAVLVGVLVDFWSSRSTPH